MALFPCSHYQSQLSSAKVKEKAMIRNLSKAGEAGTSFSMDNVMWHGQICKPMRLQEMLHCRVNLGQHGGALSTHSYNDLGSDPQTKCLSAWSLHALPTDLCGLSFRYRSPASSPQSKDMLLGHILPLAIWEWLQHQHDL